MIILLGLPKSGTTSFHELFKKLGYKSYHWKKGNNYIGKMIENNKKNKRLLLSQFSDTDVITQMDICVDKHNCYWPQIVDYKQIIEENPDAIFILNKRNPETLLSSFKRWGNLDQRLFKYNPEIIADKTDKGFINFVEDFYLKIESYFKEKKNLKFISYDINNDKVEKLKKYIDIKNIRILPKVNVNSRK
jgi:hypothetical protein|tara:strand:- start:224 stop:793 length:570 start_codon:yes stop_codon:yes gene_type:complete